MTDFARTHLEGAAVQCPACTTSRHGRLDYTSMHLHYDHDWSFEDCAEWSEDELRRQGFKLYAIEAAVEELLDGTP